jgi:hypothetical protein
MVSFWRWRCANSAFWHCEKHDPCLQTKTSLSYRILSSFFFCTTTTPSFFSSRQSLLLWSELARLFLFYCAVSLAWGRKAYCTIVWFLVTQDYLGWPLHLGETLTSRTSNKKLNGQSAVSTRLPTLQHPLEKQVTSLQELHPTRNFLQTHLQEPEFSFWFTSNAFLSRLVLLKYWLLCPFSTRKPHAKAVPRKDYFMHLTLKNARKGCWVISPDYHASHPWHFCAIGDNSCLKIWPFLGLTFEMHAMWQGYVEEPAAKDFIAKEGPHYRFEQSTRNPLGCDQVQTTLGNWPKPVIGQAIINLIHKFGNPLGIHHSSCTT